jgi:hypothetical protein
MSTDYAQQKEAEILARLEDATRTNGKRLSEEEAEQLTFEAMLFLIRTRGL